MKRIFTLFLMLTFLFTVYSQLSNCPPSVTHNGVTYQTIWVGGNCWMKENLRSTAYGTQSNVTDLYPGLTPTYMVYPGAPLSMGYLYTWYSAVGLPQGSTNTPPTAISERVQGICPNEWAIPSATQLESLIASGETRSGVQTYWAFNNGIYPGGSNGFLMVPSGFYNARFGQFAELNHVGYIWTLNYNGATSTCGIFPFDCRPTASMSLNKNSLLSVRCVKAPPYGIEEMTVCDSVTWNGKTYYTSGRYVANLPNDSVSTLLLTVNYTTYATANVTACDSYTWDVNEKTYTTSGTHIGIIKNHKNCDSVVTLNLTVNYQNTGIDVQNHCDSYTWIDGITYYESTNEPTFTLANANAMGCDSVVTLNLTIRNKTYGIDVQNRCDTYTWIDGITYTESTNEPTFTLTNAAGCDSVVTLNLTIRKKTYGIDVQNHCDSYTWMNDVTYTESTNEPVFTITNEAGCDSIVTLNLTIRKKTASPSQSYEAINTYTWNGVTYTTSGVYTATLTNAVGCDSTATLDLTVLYQFPITYNVNDGVLPAEYPIDYIQGIGATLPIPTKLNNRFDGWYDNATFTGSPMTAVSNSESGDKQYYALWTVLTTALNSSLSFNGTTSSYASIPDAPALNITNAITLEAWINPASWIYRGTVISKESTNRGYVLRISSSGALSFAFGNSSSTYEIITVSPHPLVLNQWQHVAATYDGTTMKLYRNGVQVATKAQTGAIATNTSTLDISRSSLSTYRYFNGKIDEVRVFNVALDAATIQSWYNKTVNNTHGNYANLVGYYECDSTANDTAITGTVGSAGTVAGATYGAICSTPFNSSTSVMAAPSSVTASHPILGVVVPGEENALILKVQIKTAIDASITQVRINTTGTTNIANITNAKLWYTGSSNSFASTTQFGSTIINPDGTMTFNGNIPATCGSIHNFWLTYDITPNATFNNFIDASLADAIVERLVIIPDNGSPTGNRKIADACTHILQIGDQYDDSWNGGYASLYVNNNIVLSDITIANSYDDVTWISYPFYAETGDTIRVIRTVNGSYPNEMRVKIIGGNGGPIILPETVPTPAPGVFAIGGCYEQITGSAGENGTITPAGVVPVLKNGNQTFTFVPNTNCWLDSLIVDGINRPDSIPGKSFTFTNVNEPHTIRSVYNANIITATAGANGTISSSGATVMAPNSSKTYTMTPNTNYFLDSLIVDGINRPDSIPNKRFTFNNVNEDHTIRVVFRTITIISSTGPNGTINPLGTTNKLPGSSQKYTITPNQYYFLDSLIVNGINVPDSIPGKSYTFTNVNAPHTIRATFKTNYVTPTLITPPTIVGTPIQDNALSTLSFTGGLVQYNSVTVPGTFSWVSPTTLLVNPGNYQARFTPTDTNSYFGFTFNMNVSFNFSYLLVADGTTTNNKIPFEGYNLDGAQHNQMIFPASMLTAMVGRQITSITFYLSAPPAAAWTAVSTYKVGSTTTNTLSGLIADPSTTVYTGLMPVVSNTVTITFTAPFTYTGDNLIIDFSNVIGNWKTASFYGITQTNASYWTRNTSSTLSVSFLPKMKIQLVP